MNFIKKIFTIFFSVFVVIYLIITPSIILPILSQKKQNFNTKQMLDTTTVLEVWNIDTFEGGSVSRKSWLEKRAIEFESKNLGVYFFINNITLEQAKLNIQNGKYPSLISFGIGIGELLIDNLVELDIENDCNKKLLDAGKFNGKQFAIPYMFGSYFSFEKNSEAEFITGNNGCNLPILSFLSVGKTVSNKSNSFDTYMAYENFLSSNYNLLGTQRDLVRINNRISNNSISGCIVNQQSNFSDLVQFISVTTKDFYEQNVCKNFIAYLISKKVQQTISSIYMFSSLNDILSGTTTMINYEKALKKNFNTINVFTKTDDIKQLQDISFRFLSGEKTFEKDIVKFLI